ncbi:MAG TPA: peptide chain release factor N(5)-glutamine methyltransferase [bacterium]|nr:peptide chain release factor N(5)-glutamine methyltransferase [bacterium]
MTLPAEIIASRSSRELLKWSIATLKAARVVEASYESRYLMARALGVKPGLVQLASMELDAHQMAAAAELVARRVGGEPFQYILGETGFRRGMFWCRPGVLIPRPETETLVERAASHLYRAGEEHLRILELGTGSGAPIVALAMDFPRHTYVATDIDPVALELAQENAERNGVGDRIAFLQGDWWEALEHARVNIPFHIILSNPPYIPTGGVMSLPREIRDFEPHAALDGGFDGLAFYRRLVGQLPTWLRPGGWVLVEVGEGQAGLVQQLFERAGLVQVEVTSDLHSLPRVVEGRMPYPGEEALEDG